MKKNLTKEKISKKSDKLKGIKNEETKQKEVKEVIETDVDKLYELIMNKGVVKVSEASKILNTSVDQIEEWGKVLEEHNLIRLRYPPIGEPVLILKKFSPETEKIKNLKKDSKKPKKAFVINLLILIAFFAFIVFYVTKTPIRITLTYTQAYLITAAIIVIGLIIILKIKKVKIWKKKESK